MSGFVAVWNLDRTPVDGAVVVRMRDTLVHRGAAGAELRTMGEVALAYRSHLPMEPYPPGRQPLCNDEGTIGVVFDGHVLNARNLASRFGYRGDLARPGSGGALLLHLYEVGGAECVRLLNGPFSFALWDARERVFLGARDHLGINPFFYACDERRLVVASEVKAILADPGIRRAPCMEGLAGSLFSGAPLGDRTLFAGIRQLLPGQLLLARDGHLEVRAYWDVEYRYAPARGDTAVVGELRELLIDAVRIRCPDGAPLGCQLSGGLDSSLVTGIAARQHSPLKAFSIRFGEGEAYDETHYARRVAEHVGAEYYEDTPTAQEFAANLPALIWHQEVPPPAAGGFSYYAAAMAAAQHTDTLLAGHGGDEVFGGYPGQFALAFGSTAMFASRPPSQAFATPFLARARRVLRRGGTRKLLARFLPRPAQTEAEMLEERWIRLHCGAAPAADSRLSDRFIRALGGYSPEDDYLALFRAAPTDELFDRALYHDLRSYLPTLLLQVDRLGAAVGTTIHSPLLDPRIIEFMATVPPEQKVRERIPKQLLRKAAEAWLPEEILARRDKAGFPVPLSVWLAGELKPWAQRILRSPQCLDRGIFHPDELRRGQLHPMDQLQAINVELWFRIFIDQDPAWCSQTDRIARAPPGVATAGAHGVLSG